MIKPGDILLEKYKVLSFIAKGGMSTVWLTEDLTLERKWAIKVIDKAAKEFKASVNADGSLTEIVILSELDNPFAPRIVDRYEDEKYLAVVMDYVHGKNLLDVIKEHGPQEPDEVISWMLCVCELLTALHNMKQPAIYCDVKPENIILKEDNSIKVIDFGIAKIPDKYENYTPIGTPGYASPEHYTGRTDARSDIYSLGMTMYHLLTGDNPAVKGFKMASIKEKNPSVSKHLEEIIIKCIHKKPENRYQTATEVKNALWECKIKSMTEGKETQTVLLAEGNGSSPKAEVSSMPSAEKETPAKALKQNKGATILQVLFSGISGLVRTIAFLLAAVLSAIGIYVLLEPELRSLFLQKIIEIYDTILSK